MDTLCNDIDHLRAFSFWSKIKSKFLFKYLRQFSNDFFRCLVKDYEQRPYVWDLLEHPFVKQVPEDSSKVSYARDYCFFEIQFGKCLTSNIEIVLINKLHLLKSFSLQSEQNISVSSRHLRQLEPLLYVVLRS